MRKVFSFLLILITTGLFTGSAVADDVSEIARAAAIAVRGVSSAGASQTAVPSRANSGRGVQSVSTAAQNDTTTAPARANAAASRALSDSRPTVETQSAQVGRTAITPRDNVQSAITSRGVAARTTVLQNSAERPTYQSGGVNRSAANTTVGARSTLPPASTARSATSRTTTGTTIPTRRTAAGRASNISRAATSAVELAAATSAATADYKLCRETFYQCMDEFCASKDTTLKRCACSTRYNEFENQKKQLEQIESQMLDFNEQLLVVNMDKEDATAMLSATEGETAFQLSDKSDSKSILDNIMKKLKASTTNESTERDLSAISLSMNTDSAWDSIDSFMGADTSTKQGLELYTAALPVCLDIIAEVCDEESAKLVQSAYQMAIEQDCNTVSNAYAARFDAARESKRESDALLDMSRLDNYQTRNADDILTCKKKMLDMMADNSVCGSDFGKCLDWSGKYIDPGTGQAILTDHLSELANTITKPTGNEKWASMPGNSKFVSFLNSKRKYLEPAMQNCEQISSRVWTEFLEDALAQIRLSQGTKLEDMRQSCTSLTTTCISGTASSLTDFDSRALSIFGVNADKTVNEMCKNIQSACTALMQNSTGGEEWNIGMTEIATDKTYETILSTCTQVGKNCIIQQCKNTSGNFGLCENINSINRRNVLNRVVCWEEVQKCVSDAGTEQIARIIERQADPTDKTFYESNYGNLSALGWINTSTDYENLAKYHSPYDLCGGCDATADFACQVCRVTEKIWGNCEYQPSTSLNCPNGTTWNAATGLCEYNIAADDTGNKVYEVNRILPGRSETLLYWFAKNTSTDPVRTLNSCYGALCPVGSVMSDIDNDGNLLAEPRCIAAKNFTSDGESCGLENQFNVSGIWSNCCRSGIFDVFGNCCGGGFENGTNNSQYYINISPADFTSNPTDNGFYTEDAMTSGKPGENQTGLCISQQSTQYIGQVYDYNKFQHIFCVDGQINGETYNPTNETAESSLRCDGGWLLTIEVPNGLYTYSYYSVGTKPNPAVLPNGLHTYIGEGTATCEFTVSGDSSQYGSWTATPSTAICNKINGAPNYQNKTHTKIQSSF